MGGNSICHMEFLKVRNMKCIVYNIVYTNNRIPNSIISKSWRNHGLDFLFRHLKLLQKKENYEENVLGDILIEIWLYWYIDILIEIEYGRCH